jgi:hypothetical protein
MDISKIKEGKRVSYTARKTSGRGVVESIYDTGRGKYVLVNDKTNKLKVAVRPSQLGS